MRKVFLSLLIIFASLAHAQQMPRPVGVYQFSGGTWGPLTTAAAFGFLNYTPSPAALYCQSAPGAPWSPCVFSGGGGGAVDSVFGRTGAVVAQAGDYSSGQITGLGTAATVNTGTSGATIPLLNVANTWSANQTFPNIIASFILNGASANNASISPLATGTSISRNVADANAALTVTQTNAASTGNIANFSNNTGVVASISQAGAVVAPFLLSPTNLAVGTMNSNSLVLQTNATPRWLVGVAPGSLTPATNNGQTIGDSTHNLSNLFTNSLVLAGAQALTSVQGTAGTKVPAASGTFTSGNLRSTNATGDEVDAGVPANFLTSLPLSCQPGLGDGLNAITAGTYLNTTCRNETGKTWTLTAIRCVADAGSSTCNVTNGAGTALLTGAITGTSTYANGTQSGTTTIASGDFLKIAFVADGTTKQIGIDVAGTY